MFRTFAGLLACVWLALANGGSAMAESSGQWSPPADADIRNILVERIDAQHQGVGIVVGVIDAHGRRIVSYGALNPGDTRPLNADTVFEIGSMTKVFTSLLLADMVQRGEVRLDDPAVKFLPSGASMPERGGRQITLIDLATHTSGLPRLPDNLAPKDPANPYADYSVDQLYQFLSRYTLPRDIGERYEYSNLGGGLLGHILARRAGVDYEDLVHQRITGPLGMGSTAITLSPDLKARMAVGHDQTLKPVENWDLPTLAGAGALRSTTNDLLVFLAAELGYTDTPLKTAMAAQIAPRQPTGMKNVEVALGWHVSSTSAGEIIWHNGGTGGFRTFMGFDPKARAGVVVLTNTATAAGGDDIGFHLLTGSPLKSPPAERHAVALGAGALEPLVGRYQLAPQAFVTVTRDGDHLFAQLTSQGAYEIFAEGPNDFFWRIVDAQVTFQRGADGHASGLVLHQNGRDTRE